MQDSTLCPRQYLHAPLLCRGALCRVSHQPGKYGIKTKTKTQYLVGLTQGSQVKPVYGQKAPSGVLNDVNPENFFCTVLQFLSSQSSFAFTDYGVLTLRCRRTWKEWQKLGIDWRQVFGSQSLRSFFLNMAERLPTCSRYDLGHIGKLEANSDSFKTALLVT